MNKLKPIDMFTYDADNSIVESETIDAIGYHSEVVKYFTLKEIVKYERIRQQREKTPLSLADVSWLLSSNGIHSVDGWIANKLS